MERDVEARDRLGHVALVDGRQMRRAATQLQKHNMQLNSVTARTTTSGCCDVITHHVFSGAVGDHLTNAGDRQDGCDGNRDEAEQQRNVHSYDGFLKTRRSFG